MKVAIASFAHTHASSYAGLLAGLPDVSVLTADPDGAAAPDSGPRGAEFAARHGVPYVDSYDELFAWGPDAVVVTSEKSPLPALSLAEVLATSDVPGGVVNVLSGRTAEIATPLASHQDVNAIDLAGADEVLAKELEIAAADNLKRVLRPQPVDDWTATPGIDRLTAFLETKTVWHPTGSLGAGGSSY